MAQVPSQDVPSSAEHNEYFQFFGQFLTHDMAEAEVTGAEPPLFLDGLPFPFGRSPFDLDSDDYNAKSPAAGERGDELPRPVERLWPARRRCRDLLRAAGGTSARLVVGRERRPADLPGGGRRQGHPTSPPQVIADHRPERLRPVRPTQFACRRQPGEPADGAAHPPAPLDAQSQLVRRPAAQRQSRSGRDEPSSSRRPARSTRPSGSTSSTTSTSPSCRRRRRCRHVQRLQGRRRSLDHQRVDHGRLPLRPRRDQQRLRHHDGERRSDSRHLHARRGVQPGQADGIRTERGASPTGCGAQLARATQEIDGKVVDGNRNAALRHPGADRRPRGLRHRARPRPWRRELQRAARGAWPRELRQLRRSSPRNKLDADTLGALKAVYGERHRPARLDRRRAAGEALPRARSSARPSPSST